MIKLKLDPWCTHCMIFEPVKDAPDVSYVKDSHGKPVKRYSRESIYIKCLYAPACREIYGKMEDIKRCQNTEKSQS